MRVSRRVAQLKIRASFWNSERRRRVDGSRGPDTSWPSPFPSSSSLSLSLDVDVISVESLAIRRRIARSFIRPFAARAFVLDANHAAFSAVGPTDGSLALGPRLGPHLSSSSSPSRPLALRRAIPTAFAASPSSLTPFFPAIAFRENAAEDACNGGITVRLTSRGPTMCTTSARYVDFRGVDVEMLADKPLFSIFSNIFPDHCSSTFLTDECHYLSRGQLLRSFHRKNVSEARDYESVISFSS